MATATAAFNLGTRVRNKFKEPRPGEPKGIALGTVTQLRNEGTTVVIKYDEIAGGRDPEWVGTLDTAHHVFEILDEAASLVNGVRVEWTSGAAGHMKTKRGFVVQVVLPGNVPSPLPSEYGGGGPRDHVSYVVKVDGSRNKTYWPIASKLKRI